MGRFDSGVVERCRLFFGLPCGGKKTVEESGLDGRLVRNCVGPVQLPEGRLLFICALSLVAHERSRPIRRGSTVLLCIG